MIGRYNLVQGPIERRPENHSVEGLPLRLASEHGLEINRASIIGPQGIYLPLARDRSSVRSAAQIGEGDASRSAYDLAEDLKDIVGAVEGRIEGQLDTSNLDIVALDQRRNVVVERDRDHAV